MPKGWFTEPVRAWWPDFKSDLCTPGPLCMLTPSAIYADKRAQNVERQTARRYHFRRAGGQTGAVERIWLHLRKTGAPMTERAAAEFVNCTLPHLYQLLHSALSAQALVVERGPGGPRIALGPLEPVLPKAVDQ